MDLKEMQEKLNKIRTDLIIVSSELRFPNEKSPRKKRYVLLKFIESGYEIEMMFNNITKTSPVDGKRKSIPFSLEEIQEKINEIRKDLIVTDTYVINGGATNRVRYVKLKWADGTDEQIEDRTLQSISVNFPKKGVKKHDSSKYTFDYISNLILETTHNSVKMIGEYKNMDTNSTFINLDCGHEFESTPRSILRGKLCGVCSKMSKGEFEIYNFLKNNNICFSKEKTFKDMKYIKNLRFDFYIEQLNLAIEFNGRQHYEEVECFNETNDSEESLKLIQKRDLIKSEYCRVNNIKLLIIKYDMLDKNGKLTNECVELLKENLFL